MCSNPKKGQDNEFSVAFHFTFKKCGKRYLSSPIRLSDGQLLIRAKACAGPAYLTTPTLPRVSAVFQNISDIIKASENFLNAVGKKVFKVQYQPGRAWLSS